MLCCLELFWFFNKGPCIFTSSWAPQTVSPLLPMSFLQVTLCLLGCHWFLPGSLWALLRAGVPASANQSILSIGIRKWNSSIPSSSWTNKQMPFVYGFSCLQGKQNYQRDHSRGFSYTVPQWWPLCAQLQCLFCSVTGLAQVSVNDSCSVVSDSWPPCGLAQQVPLSMGFSRQEYCSGLPFPSSRIQFSSVQSLRRVRLFVNRSMPGLPVHHQLPNSCLWSQSLPKFMSIDSMMPSNQLILCGPLVLLPSILPSIRLFSNESALHIRWPKYWSFNFNISPYNEHPGLISFRMDWLNLLAVQGTLKSLLQHHSSKASILWHSAFFTVQLSHPYMTTGKTIALIRWTFVDKVMSLPFNVLLGWP